MALEEKVRFHSNFIDILFLKEYDSEKTELNILDLNHENFKGDTSSFYKMLQHNINDQNTIMERELEDSELNTFKENNAFTKEDLKKKENDQILDDFLPIFS